MTQYLSQLSLARLFAAALLLGIVLGALYDIFRIRRIAFPGQPKRSGRGRSILAMLLLHTEDLLFGVTAGVATALLYFALSRGQVRLMAIFGEGVGFLLYRQTLGRLVMRCADSIVRLIAMILRLLVRYVIRPPLCLNAKAMRILWARLIRWRMRLRVKRLRRIGRAETERYCEVLAELASNGFETIGQANQKKNKHKD